MIVDIGADLLAGVATVGAQPRPDRSCDGSNCQILPLMSNRDELITVSLKRHNLAQWVKPRIDALLDGKEDRSRLSCCNGGCFVCVFDLLAVVNEVETGVAETGNADGPTA